MMNNNQCDCDCKECAKRYDFPHKYCCLDECGEHEFCRGCTKGIYKNNTK